MRPAVLSVLVFVMLAPSARADEAALRRAVDELGHESFAVRERAAAALWAAGEEAEPFLRRALESGDAEVCQRARLILARLEHGLRPDTPPEIAELVIGYTQADADGRAERFVRLVELGPPAHPHAARLAAREDDPEVCEVIARVAGQDARFFQGLLLAGVGEDVVEAVLERAAAWEDENGDAYGDYVGWMLVRGRLDAAAAVFGGDGRRASTPGARRVLLLAHRARGDAAAAAKLAEASEDDGGRGFEELLVEAGDFRGAADRLPEPEAGGGARGFDDLAFWTTYQRLAGRPERFERGIGLIREQGEGNADRIWGASRVLLANGRADAALEMLVRGGQVSQAVGVLALRAQYRRALECAGLGPDGALTAGASAAVDNPAVGIEAFRVLAGLGLQDRARALASAVARAALARGDADGLAEVIVAEVARRHFDEAFAHAAEAAGLEKFRTNPARLFHVLFPERAGEAWMGWTWRRWKEPGESRGAALGWLRERMEGRGPGDARAPVRDAAAVAESLPEADRKRWRAAVRAARRAAGDIPPVDDPDATAEDLFGDGDAWAAAGRWDRAADAYGAGRAQVDGDPWAVYRHGHALARAGRKEEGERLMRLASLLPLGDAAARQRLAEALDKRGLAQEAAREWERVVALGRFPSEYVGSRWAAADRLMEEGRDLLRAAALRQQALVCLLRSNSGFSLTRGAGYLGEFREIQRDRVRGLAAAGRLDEAIAVAVACREAVPADLDAVLAVVPELDRKGRRDDADRLFDPAIAVWEGVCRDFPDSHHAHNQAAWLAARCHRRLDAALAHAMRAVALAPENVHCLDTLAEVHFHRGDRARAVELESECVKRSPEGEIYRRQLERFRTEAMPE